MLASNIANAATPNYKARDIDFQKALAAASASMAAAANAGQRRGRRHIGYRVPLETSLDGNTVELSTEQNQFAENASNTKRRSPSLKGRIGTVMRR
jgi:flagellar basal-body rod protein FlgB